MADADLILTDAVVHVPDSDPVLGWISIRDGKIDEIADGTTPNAHDQIDCAGRDVIPGVIDIHTHFRDPGDTAKEDFTTGSLAAAFGGVTTVIDMPNTGHLVITPADFREKRDYLASRSYVNFGLHALCADSAPYVDELCDLGVAGLKWLLGYDIWKGIRCQPSSNARLRETLIAAAERDLLVGTHAEALVWMKDLKADLSEHERSDVQAHGESRPPFVESIAVAEVAILAAEFGGRMHIHHLTSEGPLRTALALRQALGGRLTIETCPQYLFLTEADVVEQGPAIKVNPPMRAESDRDFLWMGVASGEIDIVASDHAPHRADEKAVDSLWDVPPGVLGVETMLPLMLDAVAEGKLTMRRMVQALSERPAEVVRLDERKGGLVPGRDADLVVVDRNATTVVRGERLHSKPQFTPYEGRELRGAIEIVLLGGRRLIEDGRLQRDEPAGEFTPSSYHSVAV